MHFELRPMQPTWNPSREPLCFLMSMRGKAARAALAAPFRTAVGGPTKVKTVRLVEAPGSTSSKLQPWLPRIASAMASITSLRLPSEKLGTHSTSFPPSAIFPMIKWLVARL